MLLPVNEFVILVVETIKKLADQKKEEKYIIFDLPKEGECTISTSGNIYYLVSEVLPIVKITEMITFYYAFERKEIPEEECVLLCINYIINEIKEKYQIVKVTNINYTPNKESKVDKPIPLPTLSNTVIPTMGNENIKECYNCNETLDRSPRLFHGKAYCNDCHYIIITSSCTNNGCDKLILKTDLKINGKYYCSKECLPKTKDNVIECEYIFQRGDKKGTRCNIDSIAGTIYCNTHVPRTKICSYCGKNNRIDDNNCGECYNKLWETKKECLLTAKKEEAKCEYILQRDSKKGTRCNVNSTEGSSFCRIHTPRIRVCSYCGKNNRMCDSYLDDKSGDYYCNRVCYEKKIKNGKHYCNCVVEPSMIKSDINYYCNKCYIKSIEQEQKEHEVKRLTYEQLKHLGEETKICNYCSKNISNKWVGDILTKEYYCNDDCYNREENQKMKEYKKKEKEELNEIKKNLGLKDDVDYNNPENLKKLKYGNVLITSKDYEEETKMCHGCGRNYSRINFQKDNNCCNECLSYLNRLEDKLEKIKNKKDESKEKEKCKNVLRFGNRIGQVCDKVINDSSKTGSSCVECYSGVCLS